LGTALSFCLVAGGLGLRAWAGINAGLHTRSSTIEAPRLITSGPYGYVRNPIYLGTIVLGLGMVGLLRDPRLFAVAIGIFAFLYFAIIPAEEQFLQMAFDGEYDTFRTNVPRLLPRLRPWAGPADSAASVSNAPVNWRAAKGDLHIGLLLVAIYAGMRLILRLRG
jgi:protein-S-isoprenylcysteine O-methyltransferase Ste14